MACAIAIKLDKTNSPFLGRVVDVASDPAGITYPSDLVLCSPNRDFKVGDKLFQHKFEEKKYLDGHYKELDSIDKELYRKDTECPECRRFYRINDMVWTYSQAFESDAFICPVCNEEYSSVRVRSKDVEDLTENIKTLGEDLKRVHYNLDPEAVLKVFEGMLRVFWDIQDMLERDIRYDR